MPRAFRVDSQPLARTARLLLGLAAAGLVAGFAVAAMLTPDPSSVGTHQQLGLPPCGVMLWLGRPCPACGLTTSLSNIAHGDVAAAWTGQPVGVLIAVASVIAIGVCGEAAWRGRWRLPVSPLATAVIAIWTLNAAALARWWIVG